MPRVAHALHWTRAQRSLAPGVTVPNGNLVLVRRTKTNEDEVIRSAQYAVQCRGQPRPDARCQTSLGSAIHSQMSLGSVWWSEPPRPIKKIMKFFYLFQKPKVLVRHPMRPTRTPRHSNIRRLPTELQLQCRCAAGSRNGQICSSYRLLQCDVLITSF